MLIRIVLRTNSEQMSTKNVIFFAIIKKMCIFAGLNASRESYHSKKVLKPKKTSYKNYNRI